MSLTVVKPIDIWVEICQKSFPDITENQIIMLAFQAATAYYNDEHSDLHTMFDQYLMLKYLKGLKDESQEENQSSYR